MNAALPLMAIPSAAVGLQLQVRAIRYQAEGINAFDLMHPEGEQLPEVEAGAHVDVHLPGGHVRSYSLAGDPRDRLRWTLGVLREPNGRGGSRSLHDNVRVGELLTLGEPRNAFKLKRGADHVILIAGGIGVTPLKAMAHELMEQGVSFEMHYCARSWRNVAFLDELQTLVPKDRLCLHLDGGDPARGLNLVTLLADPGTGRHVYYCGPAGFMNACADATSHWPAGTVHCEHFKAPVQKAVSMADGTFEVKLARSGVTVQVAPDQTIVRAIELAGHRIPTSCLSGLCGSCKVNYLEGEVDHQDYILSDEEKRTCLTTCVSRCRSATLVLDL